MDSSHTSLPNVDRANSTLLKRYLDEQHKSVIKSNNYPQLSLPMNSTIQITHTHRQQQQDTYISKVNNNNNNQAVLVKRKYSNGRKPSGDMSKQRSSHTSRFMKRFQRQHKTNDTITNVQKRDGKPRFEFHDPSTRIDQETQCTCLASSNRNRGGEELQHHHHCPAKRSEVPHLSLNDRFHSTSQHRRQPIHGKIAVPPPPSAPPPPKHSRSPLPMLPPTTTESISNLTYPIEQNPLPSPSIDPSTILHSESETLILDPPIINLSNEYYPLVNDFLQDLSIEMNDKISVDIILEIEESLAQRIYDCIVEQDDENENDTKSYSTITNDSSALSAPPPPPPPAPIVNNNNNIISNESNDLPPSPISTTTREIVDHQEKYFQPIREQPSTSFNNLLDRNRHSTPFNPLNKQIQNDTRSPFTQSLLEPVNLLRTVNNNNNDDFHFIPPSFSFDNQQLKSELSTISYQSSFSFLNHLLPPQTTPIEKNPSAFKPIEPASTRTTTPFVLKRPQVQKTSTGVNWFGQS